MAAYTDGDTQPEGIPESITRTQSIDENGHLQDEETPLLPPLEPRLKALTSIGTIITVLLLGEFISNADATLVMAAAGRVSSEFNRLRDASWLSTGYTLGLCTAQLMYGKLSDIYGRKPLLLLSYILFAAGCIISGVGSHIWEVILGRAISGMGGAGIITISAIIITDIVPKREVASWRAYVNIAMTLGRSLGGPVGGWLSDTIGWRWLFILQAPFLVVGAVLVIVKLNIGEEKDFAFDNRSGRLDLLGIGLLGASIIAMTTLLDQGGKSFPWTSWWTVFLGSGGVLLLVAFVVVEAYVASEPIFNLRILRRTNVSAAYIIGALQTAAQLGMMFAIPLYFQITQRASTTVAGVHLVPAVVGNALGGLLAGVFIRRTGQFKILLVIAGLVASLSYLLLYLYWEGKTGFWQSLFILPGGLGTGISAASSFIAMSSMLPPEEMAMATAGYMLVVGFSITAGVTTSNSVLGMGFQRELSKNLHGPGSEEIIKRAMSDTNYIAHLSGQVREIVVACYVSGLKHTYRELGVDSIVLLGCLMLTVYSGLPGLFTSGVV
ncbi:hypothetical protein N7457_007649 [Penicillium paradoxum]|uniref:uncharacterized protein n=1 Tax=Penicillium paradoxum TaxID=176176 RepID=UPI0025483BB9|nr:uncharacterized protein N7457_007649 [Penicillium paradoxum]KAJ5772753.1 hypothetical protein N7457_007649 [Penicillium paradoxum]